MKKPIIIGIAGGTASGKSTLARQLSTALSDLRVRVVGMDSYFKRGDDVPTFFSPSRQRMMPDHNRPDTADLPKLCADVDAMCASSEHDVLIIEGLMTLHDDAVRARCDLKVFIETDDDVRVIRRVQRTLERNPHATLDDITGYYFESAHRGHHAHVAPSRKHADVVVFGGKDFGMVVSLLAAWSRSCHSERSGRSAKRNAESRR
jgi:uridine kinase